VVIGNPDDERVGPSFGNCAGLGKDHFYKNENGPANGGRFAKIGCLIAD